MRSEIFNLVSTEFGGFSMFEFQQKFMSNSKNNLQTAEVLLPC